MVHSATVAAREADKGADVDTVLDAIQQILSVHGIDMKRDDAQEPDDVQVVLDDGVSAPDEYGSLNCPLPTNDVESGEVRATVCVDLSATRFRDALESWGVSFMGRMLKASSLVMKEYEQDLGLPDWPDD